jgi:hypothetical protein
MMADPVSPLTAKLRPHVDALKADAAAGDKDAQGVIRWYQMHCRCPGDPGAPVICEKAFEAWQQRRP